MPRNSRNKRSPKRRKRRPPPPDLNPDGIDVSIAESANRFADDCEETDSLMVQEFHDVVLAMHPDFEQFIDNHGELPAQLVNDLGETWSPQLHLSLHEAVESQLANDEPAGIVDLAMRFESEGKIGTHEIRHVLMNAMAGQIFEMQKHKRDFDSAGYLREIEQSYRQFSG